MDPTPVSLLNQLRTPGRAQAWNRFAQLYTPLLYDWARRLGLQDSDAADLVQEVFVVLVRQLPGFRYEPGKSFRGWLRTVLANKWRDRRRVQVPVTGAAALTDLAAPDEVAEIEEAEYRHYLVGRALELLRPEFPAATWQAFQAYGLAGRAVAEVAAELNTSVNAVYLAKSRVLRRLRQELEGLLD
jgi:RNA polymerase sigma-70 factor (ECF subfamily)